MNGVNGQRARPWLTTSGALSVAAGLVVLVALIWTLGPAEIRDGVLSVGWAFPVIVALGGLRFFLRACAWVLCLEPPHRLPLRRAFTAVLAGDALGNATPLGPLVGEPAKAAYVRQRVPAQPALTALAIENIFYTLATAAMIAAGTIGLLFAFEVPDDVRSASEIAVGGMAALIAISLVVLWRRPAVLSRWLPLGGSAGSAGKRSRLRALEEDVYSFASRRPAAVGPVILFEAGFHALGVAETHLTLTMLLGGQPDLLTSFVLETASRLLVVLFKVVPMQLGVAELGLAGFTPFLGISATFGTSFALVRRARILIWAAAGGALLVRSGIRPSHPPNP